MCRPLFVRQHEASSDILVHLWSSLLDFLDFRHLIRCHIK
jgi:hypothetical protein